MNFYSQIDQDKWVCETLKYKTNGYWVDIGCGEPTYINNTYAFETQLGWKGISIDLDPGAIDRWKKSGRNVDLLIHHDALTLDYEKLFESNSFPNVIDYLSLDLEPPTVTLEALYKLPFDKYKFRCITFETDDYRNFGTKLPSREFLISKGYTLVVSGRQDDFWIHKDFQYT